VNAEDGKIKQEILLDYSQLLTAEADKPEVIKNKNRFKRMQNSFGFRFYLSSNCQNSLHTRTQSAISWR